MDEGLIARWRHGEPGAASRMRRLISALVEAMWHDANTCIDQDSSPNGLIGVSSDVPARLARAVADVWQDGPAAWELVRRRCVWCCARQWAESVERTGDQTHPPVRAVVSAALRDPTDAPTDMHRVVGAHSPNCDSCSSILRAVRTMDHFSRSWQPSVEPDQGGAPSNEGKPARPKRTDRSPSATKSTMFLRKTAKPRAPRGMQLRRSAGAALWPVVAIWGALAWWQWGPQAPSAEQPDHRYASLVDKTPPAAPPVSALPRKARDVRRDLLAGDCFTAAARGRGIQLKHPDHVELGVLVAASMVCAGKGREAEAILQPLLESVPGGRGSWLMAQAHLLQGHPDAAMEWLSKASRTDARLRPRAEALMSLISTARNSP